MFLAIFSLRFSFGSVGEATGGRFRGIIGVFALDLVVNVDPMMSTLIAITHVIIMIILGDSVASVKTPDCENYDLDDPKNDYQEILEFQEGQRDEIEDEIVLCAERDEKGWQCGKVVKNGNTMCDHHISVWTTNKKSRWEPEPINELVAGSRARQTKKQASTGPYEFYYYSGFGPSWGKKRAVGGSGTTNAYKEPTKIKGMRSTDDDMDIRKDIEIFFEPDISNVVPTKMELASIDDDNKKGKMGIVGKKRGRKPIKARSLKSLM
ncbi:hypothetical protein L2E82_41467 [Cichorium intybus]|uniref:Uncharacterized protein n=1 Tax=Cichorium intybus TaxID=13427 RepID=A0ACB9ANI9_CICIN|nr:hypothetical protein L2E82_41467 [Cichorium intybus]